VTVSVTERSEIVHFEQLANLIYVSESSIWSRKSIDLRLSAYSLALIVLFKEYILLIKFQLAVTKFRTAS